MGLESRSPRRRLIFKAAVKLRDAATDLADREAVSAFLTAKGYSPPDEHALLRIITLAGQLRAARKLVWGDNPP